MALFPLPVKAEMSDRFSMPVRKVRFGDGYMQVAKDGLNRENQTWDVDVIISSAADSASLQAFLIEYGQHKIFEWQSPRDTSPQQYRILGEVSGIRRNGGGSKPIFFIRKIIFERAYELVLAPPPLPIVSVVAVGNTGWTIFTSTNAGISVNYAISVVISGTPNTTNYTVNILPGTTYIFIPIGSSTIDRTETLGIYSLPTYTIGFNFVTITIVDPLILSIRFESAPFTDDTGKPVSNQGVGFDPIGMGIFGAGIYDKLQVNFSSLPSAEQIGTGDFTIECNVIFNAIGGGGNNTPNNQYIFDWGTNDYRFAWYDGSWSIYDSAFGFLFEYADTPTIGQSYKTAICRSNGTERFYLDGILKATWTSVNKNLISNLAIGNTTPDNVIIGFRGNMDIFIIKKVADYP